MRLHRDGIVAFYLVPQLKGAGLTLVQAVGAPYWVGVVCVGGVVAGIVASGGMRGITYVQAFQFWIKTFAIALPAILLLIHLGGLPERAALFGHEYPKAPAGGLTIELGDPGQVTFPLATAYTINGRPARAGRGEDVDLPAGTLRLPGGAAVPVADGTTPQRGTEWAQPVGDGALNTPLAVYSLLLATFLGTMGLPHILVRFYTNQNGPMARRTTVRVLGLLALFYAFPAVYGALGRVVVPELYTTGGTDAVVLGSPGRLAGAGRRAAGSAGRRRRVRGVPVHGVRADGLARRDAVLGSVRPAGGRARGASAWRRSAGVVPPVLLALAGRDLDITVLVGWAFALAASTFCPLLLLGIWWSRLTARGAAAGLVSGALAATGLIFTGLALQGRNIELDALLVQPAVLSVPAAFAVMIGVSLWDRARPADSELLALHAPEGLGLGQEREPAAVEGYSPAAWRSLILPSSGCITSGSRSVVTSPSSRPSAMSRSRRRMILPERVFGQVVGPDDPLGPANLIRPATCSRISATRASSPS